MSEFMDYLIVLVAAIMFSLIAAYSIRKNTFSTNLFLSALAIAVCILLWIPMLPIEALLIPAVIITSLLIKPHSGSATIE